MIIQNIVIGCDMHGHKLHCGDICNFKVKLQRSKNEENIEELNGMIIYDEDTFSYAFETLDNYIPLLLMSCAEIGSIEKMFEANSINFSNIPDGDKWKEVYNNNVIMR